MLLDKYQDYPFTIEWYANLIAQTRPDFYAGGYDYPCEPDITRKLLLSNQERIEATVASAARMVEFEEMLWPSVGVPCIQGYSLDEYIYCLDLYQKNGLLKDYMAVGSMCRRKNDKELLDVVPKLTKHARSLGVNRLHFFGLRMSRVTAELGEFIYSRDSAAILYAENSRVKEAWGGRWPRTAEQRKAAFTCFFERVDREKLIYSFDEQAVCPYCGLFDILPACEEFPSQCADCGRDWD